MIPKKCQFLKRLPWSTLSGCARMRAPAVFGR
jgi:hypothetical protein